MECSVCRKDFPDKDCIECKNLISGAYLARKPAREFLVELKPVENRNIKYYGTIKLLSPIGIALESSVPQGVYMIKLHEKLEIKVSLIKSKGKTPYQGFDIISVIRDDGEHTRLSNEEFNILCKSAEEVIEQLTEDLPETTKNLVREKLKEDVEKSQILDLFKVGTVLKYQSGRFRTLSLEDRQITLSEDYLRNFVEKALKDSVYVRDKVIDAEGEKVYDLHALPMSYNSGGLISIDVTDIIMAERKQKEKELEIYRDVIKAVTGGKLILMDEEESKKVAEEGEAIVEQEIADSTDLQKLRVSLKDFLGQFNLSPRELLHLLLCITEAATNALKHAGGGKVTVKYDADILKVIVEDEGEGIDFKKLPKATLMKSYSDSSTFSLGNGFTLMFRFTDRLYLKTSPTGTILILSKNLGLTKGEEALA